MTNINKVKQNILIQLFLISRNIRHKARNTTQDKMHRAVLLILIKSLQPISTKILSKKFSLNASSLSEILSKLEKEELITKKVAKDKRYKIISLTDQGNKYLESLNQHVEKHTESIFTDFSSKEISLLSQLLSKILNSINHERQKI